MVVAVRQFGVDQLLVFCSLLRFGDQSAVRLGQTPQVRVFGVDSLLGVGRVLHDARSVGDQLQLALRLVGEQFLVDVLASASDFEIGLEEI